MRLRIKSTMTKRIIFDADVTDKEASAIHYTLDVSLPAGTKSGEYEYILTDGVQTLATGLMQIGEYTHSHTEHPTTATYKTYGE